MDAPKLREHVDSKHLVIKQSREKNYNNYVPCFSQVVNIVLIFPPFQSPSLSVPGGVCKA